MAGPLGGGVIEGFAAELGFHDPVVALFGLSQRENWVV